MAIQKQLFRFAIVGVFSNLLLYLTYLLLTTLHMGHKTAMSLVYISGVCLTFAFNRNWTFGHKGGISTAFLRYVLLYVLGYLLNLAALYVFVDVFDYPHQIVQGVLVVLIALVLFTLQRSIVFNPGKVSV